MYMGSDTECLTCGHKRKDHDAGQSHCHKSKCPCLKFKPTVLEES